MTPDLVTKTHLELVSTSDPHNLIYTHICDTHTLTHTQSHTPAQPKCYNHTLQLYNRYIQTELGKQEPERRTQNTKSTIFHRPPLGLNPASTTRYTATHVTRTIFIHPTSQLLLLQDAATHSKNSSMPRLNRFEIEFTARGTIDYSVHTHQTQPENL